MAARGELQSPCRLAHILTIDSQVCICGLRSHKHDTELWPQLRLYGLLLTRSEAQLFVKALIARLAQAQFMFHARGERQTQWRGPLKNPVHAQAGGRGHAAHDQFSIERLQHERTQYQIGTRLDPLLK
jgi:hypothetical protein